MAGASRHGGLPQWRASGGGDPGWCRRLTEVGEGSLNGCLRPQKAQGFPGRVNQARTNVNASVGRAEPHWGAHLKKGRAATVTHDYKRHGTTTLFAAIKEYIAVHNHDPTPSR